MIGMMPGGEGARWAATVTHGVSAPYEGYSAGGFGSIVNDSSLSGRPGITIEGIEWINDGGAGYTNLYIEYSYAPSGGDSDDTKTNVFYNITINGNTRTADSADYYSGPGGGAVNAWQWIGDPFGLQAKNASDTYQVIATRAIG